MTALTAALGIGVCLGIAWGCYWQSRYHSAKAEVYQEFADTFSGMKSMYRKPDRERFMESQRRHMRLALVDPLVRDGLRSALADADEIWDKHQKPTAT